LPDHEQIISALVADGDDVDRLVANLTPDQWALPTPAERARILDDVSGPAEPSRA